MHSFDAPSGATYFHNGDFSGDVEFIVGENLYTEVKIPFTDLKALVAKYVRNARVEWLEQNQGRGADAVSSDDDPIIAVEEMSDDEVLGLRE